MSSDVTAAPVESVIDRVRRIGLQPHRTAHLVGVCGTGMRALAELLMGLGWTVTGSDLQPPAQSAWLAQRGLCIHHGHHGRHVPAEADILIHSPAVGARNAERTLALRRGLPQLSYSQMLGALMADRVGICVAGTHGKSTTTAMTGSVLTLAGLSPSVIVGAELLEVQRSGWPGQGPLFVVESCEYQRSFLDLSPRHAAILAMEPDHFDCFENEADMQAAFASFAALVPPEGSLLIQGDHARLSDVCGVAQCPVETFGTRHGVDWWAADVRRTADGTRFRVFHQSEYFCEIQLCVPGGHNVLNALAAAALCHRSGATPTQIREGLGEFPGLRRRFERVGSWKGVELIDDYAHHPTAVRVTLQAAREQYPDRRVWCVFQPHQVSRTRALLSDFAESLTLADETLIVPVFAARERVRQEPREIAAELADRIAGTGSRARFSPSLDHALATLDDELRPGDVLITMGAGNIGQLHHAFNRRLQRHHAPR